MVEVVLGVVLVGLAVATVVLLPLSLRPGIVMGPPWLGAVVVVGLLVPLVVAALLALATALTGRRLRAPAHDVAT